MEILFVVCPNGYGHIKRSVLIAEKLIRLRKKIKISWYYSNSSLEYFLSSSSNKLKEKSNIYTFNDNESISLYSLNLVGFETRFFEWSKKLDNLIIENNFDLVVSDNLATPLLYHDKCIMVGSFVWHSVIKKNSVNKNVMKSEMQVFRDMRPTIFTMKDFAMPEVTRYGNVIEVPSILNKYLPGNDKKVKKKKNSILITAGKSGELINAFNKIKTYLMKEKICSIYYDKILDNKPSTNCENNFDYTDQSFSKIQLIICRPGIGTITDAIRFDIPLIVDKYYSNLEMEFNSKKIEELGIGLRLDFKNKKKFSQVIRQLMDDSIRRKKMVYNLKIIDAGGSNIIAKQILGWK